MKKINATQSAFENSAKNIKFDYAKAMKKQKEEESQSYEKWLIETKPICPLCKSDKIEEQVQSADNGMIGPGSRSHVIDRYCICEICGLMFKNIKRKNNPYNYKNLEY